MKKFFLIFISFSLYAEECKEAEKSFWDYHPLHIGGNGILVQKAEIDAKNSSLGGHLTFNKVNTFAYFLLPINKENFFIPRIEWNAFTIDWDKNPKFHETHFQYIQFALTFFSIAIEKWHWIARGEYNVDTKHFSSPKKHSLYSVLLWGIHQLSPEWHYHLGALGYTGFEGQNVYPIIGLDYTYDKKWFFQIVFPITYSIEYIVNKEWRIGIKGTPHKERFRTGHEEAQPKSVFSYSTTSAELNIRYEKFLNLEIEAFVGYNFGGNFYIKNKSGHNPLYTGVQGAPFIGASLNWGI